MTATEVALVARWHELLNEGNVEALLALVHPDVEVGGPRGASRGAAVLRQWVGQAGARLEPLRYFHRDGTVVVEQVGSWPSPGQEAAAARQIVATVFRVHNGLITTIHRFDSLAAALAAAGLGASDGASEHSTGD